MPTMIQSSRRFPDRTEVPNTLSGSIQVKPSAMVTLDAPPQVIALNPGNPDTEYDFFFWDTNRILSADPAVTFTTPSDESNFFATAWYQQKGGNGNGTPHVTTYAFDTGPDMPIPDTPIASVAPPNEAAWTGEPSTTVSTTTSADPVVITAKPLIDGSGEFEAWLAFGGTASGPTLTVLAKTYAVAIASYGIPQPDPCALLREQRDGLSPGDFPTLEAYQRALRALNIQLHDCEKKHGEPLD